MRTSREHVDVDATSWTHIFTFDIPIWEKVLRTIVVYAAIVILLRVMGKRNLAQVNTFDLVVIFLLSNVVQNAIIGPDNSLGGGLVGAAVLIVVNNIVIPLELAHLPYRKGHTFEDYVGERGLILLGKRKWRHAVEDVSARLRAATVTDYVVLGGGNSKKLDPLPAGCRLGANTNAFIGGFRLWDDQYQH